MKNTDCVSLSKYPQAEKINRDSMNALRRYFARTTDRAAAANYVRHMLKKHSQDNAYRGRGNAARRRAIARGILCAWCGRQHTKQQHCTEPTTPTTSRILVFTASR